MMAILKRCEENGNLERITDEDLGWMRVALAQGEVALEEGEVPIGAVVVKEGRVLAADHNRTEGDRDPTAHAEILAIREAAGVLGGWRLLETTIYVTVEPCPMCVGAIIQARIPRVVFGADDPKAGAAGSLYNILQDRRFNHRAEVVGGIMGKASAELLRRFFRNLRDRRPDGGDRTDKETCSEG